jgi:HEPN domain-containing protein
MQTLTAAWAQKAEADLDTARREIRVEEGPNYDAVCFHAQQSALKYLKARLLKADIPFPSTSHLVVLLELCMDVEPEWEVFRPHLRSLNHLAAQLEDPECNPDGPMAAEAYSLARAFQDKARAALEHDAESVN